MKRVFRDFFFHQIQNNRLLRCQMAEVRNSGQRRVQIFHLYFRSFFSRSHRPARIFQALESWEHFLNAWLSICYFSRTPFDLIITSHILSFFHSLSLYLSFSLSLYLSTSLSLYLSISLSLSSFFLLSIFLSHCRLTNRMEYFIVNRFSSFQTKVQNCSCWESTLQCCRFQAGSIQPRGCICASHPAAPGSNPSSDYAEIFLFCRYFELVISLWTVLRSNPSSATRKGFDKCS